VVVKRKATNGDPISKELADARFVSQPDCNKTQRALHKENIALERKFREDMDQITSVVSEVTGVVQTVTADYQNYKNATSQELQEMKKERLRMLGIHVAVTSIAVTVIGVIVALISKSGSF